MNIDYTEINECAKHLVDLREKSKYQPEFCKEYLKYQSLCMSKFAIMVDNRVNRYKKFSNFEDLRQEGFKALVLALKTYNYDKGTFSWWADKYVKTHIYRAANAHSTIRFPLKKAKEMKPYKISIMPVIIDGDSTALESLENFQTSEAVLTAIQHLPTIHKNIINMLFGFNGIEQHSINNIIKKLSISRPQFLKALEEAKFKLKESLQSIDDPNHEEI